MADSPLPGYSAVDKLTGTAGKEASFDLDIKYLIGGGFVFLVVFLAFAPGFFFDSLGFLFLVAPLWLPPLLIYFAFHRYVEAARAETILNHEPVLLELRLPRDTKKTPLAMETIFSNLYIGAGESNWYKKYWRGGIRPYYSVELVSIGGTVRFYIWTRASLRRGVESFFYAQYPGIEIIEAEDYSRLFNPADDEHNSMFGAEFELKKPDPYPIKTYAEYGLDREGTKPEEQIDPLTQIIELFGSLGPKEQLWLQLVFRQTKKEKLGGKDWKDEAKDLVTKLREDASRRTKYVNPATGDEESGGPPILTPGEKDTIEAIEKNISKPGFDVGIRAIYSAPKDAYQGSMISLLLAMFNPFNNQSYNTLGPQSKFSAGFNDYPWEDRSGSYRRSLHRKITEYYRRRVYFHSPYIGKWMVLSSEELATLFHVPSSTIETPSLPRIQSATSGAPSNLPT